MLFRSPGTGTPKELRAMFNAINSAVNVMRFVILIVFVFVIFSYLLVKTFFIIPRSGPIGIASLFVFNHTS